MKCSLTFSDWTGEVGGSPTQPLATVKRNLSQVTCPIKINIVTSQGLVTFYILNINVDYSKDQI